MKFPRRTARAGALLLAATFLLAGCSHSATPDDPAAASSTAATSLPTAAGTTAAASSAGQPLTAGDVPGWVEAAAPDTSTSLISPCGTPTGLRERQTAVRAAAMTTPTTITVANQVADYADGSVATVLREVLAPALVSCPVWVDGDRDVVVRALSTPAGDSNAVGVQVVRTARADGSRDVSVYWATLVGTSTVEVAVSAQMGAVGDTAALEDFAGQVLTAAVAKASGKAVPTLEAPALGEVVTSQEAQQERATWEAEHAQSSQVGVAEGDIVTVDPNSTGSGDAAAGAGSGAGSGAGAEGSSTVRDTGVEGESGPSTISGSVATDEQADR